MMLSDKAWPETVQLLSVHLRQAGTDFEHFRQLLKTCFHGTFYVALSLIISGRNVTDCSVLRLSNFLTWFFKLNVLYDVVASKCFIFRVSVA